MKTLNRTLTMMLLIVGGLIFADDSSAEIINTRAYGDGFILPKQQVELTTSYVFTFNSKINSEITKTNSSI